MRLVPATVPGLDVALEFFVHQENDRHVSERIATEGIWEPFETALICRLLRARIDASGEALFVDCGANLGWYSMIAAALGSQVVAFEPMPNNAILLRSNIEHNGFVQLVEAHEIALGESPGTGSLRLSVNNQGDHRLVVEHRVAPESPRLTVDVAVRRLDDVLAGRVPSLLKLDTQGSEVAILRGAPETLATSSLTILLEFWPYGLTRCGATADELLAILEPLIDKTHRCFEILEWKQSLHPLTMAELTEMSRVGGYSAELKGFTNIVLIPLEQAAEFE